MELQRTFTDLEKATTEPQFTFTNPVHARGEGAAIQEVGANMPKGDSKEGHEFSPTDNDGSAGGTYPQNVMTFLFLVGLVAEAPSWVPMWISRPRFKPVPSLKWAYICFVRLVVLTTSLYCMCILLIEKYGIAKADRQRAGYRWFVENPSLKCHGGLSVDNDNGVEPCILLMAQHVVLPFFGASCLLMYTWLLRELQYRWAYMRSHAGRVSRNTNNFTIKYGSFSLASVILILVGICVSTRAALIQAGLSVHSTWYQASMGKVAFVGFGVGVTLLPFNAFSLLLYTECCRLHCAVEDAILSISLPFDFETQAAAFTSLHREFVDSQKAWGSALGYSIVSVTIILVAVFVNSAYIRVTNMPNEMFFQYSALVAAVSCPLIFQIRAVVGINRTAEGFKERCLSFIEKLPPAQRNPESCLVVQDALRLYTIVESQPCTLCIFGYAPNGEDVVKAAWSIVSIQVLSILI